LQYLAGYPDVLYEAIFLLCSLSMAQALVPGDMSPTASSSRRNIRASAFDRVPALRPSEIRAICCFHSDMKEVRDDQSNALALVAPTLTELSAAHAAITIIRFICPPYQVDNATSEIPEVSEINHSDIINQADFDLAALANYQAIPS
jgi:hypothetical protein